MAFEKGNNLGKRFSKENQPKSNGRKKTLASQIKAIPDDAQKKIYGILYHALRLKDETEAKAYLEAQTGELGDYGYLMQIAVRSLSSVNGWNVMMDILDRLFGTPKQSVDANVSGNMEFKFRFGDEQ